MGLISRVSSRTYRRQARPDINSKKKNKITMSDEEVIDLHAMKVTELKQELKARGLTVSGTKAELINRLENYMKEHEGVEVVEEDVDDPLEESVEEPQNPEKSSDEAKEVEQAEKAASPPPPMGISMTEEDDEQAPAVNPLKTMS